MICHPLLDEAREQINRALGGISTLHLGPLDYNISTTVDDLRTAARLIEEFGQRSRTLLQENQHGS